MKTNIRRFLMIFLMIIACSGCSLSYRLNQPDESHYKYDGGQNNPVRIQIVDKRHDTDFFIAKSNLANVDLKLQNVDDPILWFSKALQREFSSRGMAVKVDINNTINESDLILAIYQYQIVNYRATGFTPWVSYHLFNGELITGNKNFPVRAYFLYGMVPIWSMTEVQEPCIDMPMSILVKEVASKINHASLHYKLSDEKIEEMNNGINQQLSTNAADACLLILGLGGSNNQNAMKALHNLSNEEDTLIRACALSSIGMIGEQDEYNFLKSKYNQYSDIDRFMALKSIGDIGASESIAFLKGAQADPQNDGEYGIQYCVDLYTKDRSNHYVPIIAGEISDNNKNKTGEIVYNEQSIGKDSSQEISTKKDIKSINLVVIDDRMGRKVSGNHGDLIKNEPKQLIKSVFEKELKSSGYSIENSAPVEYNVEIKQCDLDLFGGRGAPLTATIDLNVQIKSIEKSFVAGKEFSETYKKVVGDEVFPARANEVLNKCINEIAQRIGRDLSIVTAINNLYTW